MIGKLYNKLKTEEPIFYKVGSVHLILFVAFGLLSLVDHRMVLGISTWYKPMKFAGSIGIFLWTMGLYLSATPRGRMRSVLRWVFVVVMVAEMVLIGIQGARGVPSHYNDSTVFNAVVFSMMGTFIYTNAAFLVTFLGWLLVRRMPDISYNMQGGLALGLLLLIVGSYMGHLLVLHGGHAVSVPEDGTGLFFLNWSRTGGDLRVAHFMALHGFQLLPVLAWVFETRVSRRYALVFTILAGIFHFTFVLMVLLQAQQGQPFL